ncbi:RNA polymerase sigma factor [Hydrogenophaga sp. PAMC20947]|uniref:RNA polymerase sigma factor n=1 Tax=Hydrogenophaga sp. PAMC20947 TaxID=2565558 RepID=UPI00109DE85E|nr:RNA polymerase sigma factor [Hydrogenophaga sp. PAMC20947]QCB48123.1 RNA polymerase sigma factor [Hydrogenophaga sp. PAMC20947]
MHSVVHDAIAAVWRAESPRIVAVVMRCVRDLGVAEELAQDTLVAALEHWPIDGVPRNPAAWLMTTARNRALDHLRHRQMAGQRENELALDMQAMQSDHTPDFSEALGESLQDDVGDDVLRLMFIACHLALSADARVALTLRLVAGLTTPEIARACLVSETTIAQRIVRAKRALVAAQVPFELPRGADRDQRLASVLAVVYLLFNEGYSATSGPQWARPDLCREALRLGELLAQIAPEEPEVHGLFALMAIQASRLPARVNELGAPVLLRDQDRRLWDRAMIRQGLDALATAERSGDPSGSYALQAAIAACHARAQRPEDTDWAHMVGLYDALTELEPSPVVLLNRAVALGMAQGPAAGLVAIEVLADHPALQRYPWFYSVRAEWLEQLGKGDRARADWTLAATLTDNEAERSLLNRRARTAAAEGTTSRAD